MTIALICPSNKLFMPYIKNYEIVLKKNNLEYEIINWDRMQIEEKSSLIFRDNKIGHQRNFIDYSNYKKFVSGILMKKKYKKIIVFGFQLAFFLRNILLGQFKDDFILDIRDYNMICKFYNFKKIIKSSVFTTISSPGYIEWLPSKIQYIINHNSNIDSLEDFKIKDTLKSKNDLIISYIGSLTNLPQNLEFIEKMKGNKRFKLMYHGAGIINNELKQFIEENSINNTTVTGKYIPNQEAQLYQQSDMINLILDEKNLNSRTCLANRLYNATLYGKPLVTLEGTYNSQLIKKYNLGLVLDSLENVEQSLIEFKRNFEFDKYQEGRQEFFDEVIKENLYFEKKLIEFSFSL